MEELDKLYHKISLLKKVTEMLKNSDFKSIEVKHFNEGSDFAYNNVLKLIEEQFKDGV